MEDHKTVWSIAWMLPSVALSFCFKQQSFVGDYQ